jgi:hypothetical protein
MFFDLTNLAACWSVNSLSQGQSMIGCLDVSVCWGRSTFALVRAGPVSSQAVTASLFGAQPDDASPTRSDDKALRSRGASFVALLTGGRPLSATTPAFDTKVPGPLRPLVRYCEGSMI